MRDPKKPRECPKCGSSYHALAECIVLEHNPDLTALPPGNLCWWCWPELPGRCSGSYEAARFLLEQYHRMYREDLARQIVGERPRAPRLFQAMTAHAAARKAAVYFRVEP